jgi:aminoglycoside 3-N-acetyltransferase
MQRACPREQNFTPSICSGCSVASPQPYSVGAGIVRPEPEDYVWAYGSTAARGICDGGRQSVARHVTRSHLIAALRALGVREGAVVMLHAAVGAIGWVVGGPRVVLDALLDLLTPAGTLVMLASWEGHPYDLPRWPDTQQATWLAACPPFDPLTSPADHRELSILAEYLRTWPGARRSDHPLASVVAVGARANWLVAPHPWQYGHGPGGPLARLCEGGGAVLVLGAPLSSITLLHHAEHLADIPAKRVDRYTMPVLRDGRTAWIAIEEYDTTEGIADFGEGEEDAFAVIARDYLATGRGCAGTVGQAPAYLFPADDLMHFGVAWMERRYRLP